MSCGRSAREGLVVEPELAGAGRSVVVDHDVGCGQQVVEPGAVVGALDVEHDAALAAHPGVEARLELRMRAPPGGSTATTSAPASASMSVETGPAMPSDRSTMRIPSRMPTSFAVRRCRHRPPFVVRRRS